VGVGLDTPADNLAWAQDEGFPYELWTDDDATLGVTYGALDNRRDSSVDRITVLLDENGDLVLQYLHDIAVGTHPEQVLQDCQALWGD
jgi:peroxiredoxin